MMESENDIFLNNEKSTTLLPFHKPIASKNPTVAQIRESRTWTKVDFLCKNYFLNRFSYSLYEYYSNCIKKKFGNPFKQKNNVTEKAGAKKLAVNYYLKYQMMDENLLKFNPMRCNKLHMR